VEDLRTLSIIRPDDWHVHFRDHKILQDTVPATAKHFARALVMPNLQPALTTLAAVKEYHDRILSQLEPTQSFHPYMTLYLNETVTPETLTQITQYPYIVGAKLYPAGVTTNAEQGARSIQALYPLFDIMQACDLVLQIHGEVTSGDIFSRENLFLEHHLKPLVHNFPTLRIVLEHISTKAAVGFVMQAPATVAATITPHHLLYNRNQLLAGGIKPHYYCLPILKSATDQLALQQAAISGNNKFFAGTDSAPHAISNKESACGCAGIYSAPFALAMYAELFDDLSKLDLLEGFMSRHGANFYHLPISDEYITLVEQTQIIPLRLPLGDDEVVPIGAGSTLRWSVYE
jgi:dihydroorotase